MRPRFSSPLRSEPLTSQLGVALGVAIAVCFGTGVLSHAIQHPPWWFTWPSRPVNLYRVTQGLHVATGLAAIPLLAAKLWSVYPRLFTWPPLRGFGHAAERAGVALLVAGTLFQVVTGVLNTARWYAPMPFFFTAAHHWTGWLVAGGLLLHLGAKLPTVRRSLRAAVRPTADPVAPTVDDPEPAGRPTRRALLTGVAATAGLLTVATVGQTLRPFAGISPLAPRDPRVGPQRLPVNRSAAAADVLATATDPGYRLTVLGPAGPLRFTVADLAGLPQYTVSLPITCVEGWSADAVWSGVRLADLVALAGGGAGSAVRVDSLQRTGRYRHSVVAAPHARDPLTLLALRLHDEPLHLDHGYPCRLIAPNRPGVLQTKWVAGLTIGRST